MAELTFDSAKKIAARFAPAPAAESTFIVHARRKLGQLSGRSLQAAYDELCRRAPTETDVDWLGGWMLEHNEAAEAAQAEAVATEVAEGLAAAEEAAQAAATQAAATERADAAARTLAEMAGDDEDNED